MQVPELIERYVASRTDVLVDGGVALRWAFNGMADAWADFSIDEIGQADFDRRAADLSDAGKKPNTIRQELALLRAALKFGARQGFRRQVEQLTLPATVQPRYVELTPEEAAILLRAAPDVETRCFIAIALMTGARRAAICELTWDRVDLRARILDFHMPHARQERRKGRALVPITEHLADYLAAYRSLQVRRPDERVCRWGPQIFYQKVVETGKRAGFDHQVTPSTLRHTAAVRMIRAAPLVYASRALGHLSVAATEAVYRQSMAETLRPAAQTLNQLLVVSCDT